MRRPGVLGGVLLCLALTRTGNAEAMWAASATGTAAARALALQPPTNLASSHPNVTGAAAGNVTLSWTPSTSAFATGTEVQRAPASCAGFSPVATLAGSTYTDATALYNQQYCYRMDAVAQNWRAPGPARPAFSLPPTAGTDTTGALPYLLTGADLAGLATGDGVRYTTQGKWTRGATGQYLELITSPAAVATAPTRARVTLVYQAALKPPAGTTMDLLVSPDNGTTWTTFALAVPGAKSVDVTATVDITSVIATPAALAQMRLRFLVGVPSGGGFQTAHDLAHVDVN